MQIIIKNKDTILLDDFKFKCSSGKNGISSKKIEGDLKTPKGVYSIGKLFTEKTKLLKLIPN
jgi:L,D-peptidoglycan transpeptidase YkuD (ErfK/YbiS/YcfS/YnhG family)